MDTAACGGMDRMCDAWLNTAMETAACGGIDATVTVCVVAMAWFAEGIE
jgi:hypothetical protein